MRALFYRTALALLVSSTWLAAAQPSTAQTTSTPTPSVNGTTPMADIKDIEPAELAARLQGTSRPYLLDVRNPDEFEDGHIEGAKLIPLSVLPLRLAEVPKDKPVVIYCARGNRSRRAYEILRQAGHNNIENLKGGIAAWRAHKKVSP